MLADNIVWLKKNMPDLYSQFKKWEEEKNEVKFSLQEAKNGCDTLVFKAGEDTVYFHSRYNPIREAETIIDALETSDEITDQTQIIFFGVGLGYHIDVFLERHVNIAFYLVEPSFEALDLYLQRVKLKDRRFKNLKGIQCGLNHFSIYDDIILNKEKKVIICEHPVYLKEYKEDYVTFCDLVKNIFREQRTSLHTNYAFQKRWVINSINNFKYVLQSPNILVGNKECFKEKIAILVSAGPSLNYEIENLKRIKKNGLAYIFTVGSAINTLVYNDLYPDAMCTYDPMEENQLAFEKINERNIDSIPMIFGTSVGYETIEQYPGPKFHMLTTQDTISDYFLKTVNSEKIEKVHDAPSIAVVTLELLTKLGFSQIILVGQNLAYLEDSHYAEGVPYVAEKVENTLMIENVEGNMVETSRAFLSMKKSLEECIINYRANVVNTTVKGARIKGTTFKALSEIIDEMPPNKVDELILTQIGDGEAYDCQYIFKRLEKLNQAYARYQQLVVEVKKCIDELKENIAINNTKRLNEVHHKMNRLIDELEKNDFFRILALPMNRVEYSVFANEINNSIKKDNVIAKIIKPTEVFINILNTERSLMDRIMEVVNRTIAQEKKTAKEKANVK